MKVAGSHVLHAPPRQVWDVLRDPAVLVRTIPGCEELVALDYRTYTARVRAGVASVTGTYDGRLVLSDQVSPASYTLRATGGGAAGTVDATATVRLTETPGGDTQVAYEADAVVGGTVGGVGGKVLAGVAQRNATEFFEAVDRYLAGELDAAEPAAADPGGDAAAPARTSPRVERGREPAPPAGAQPAQLVLAGMVGVAIALLAVWLGRRMRS